MLYTSNNRIAGVMSEPLYKQVYNELLARIQSGEYASGSSIPSEPKLKQEFGVSIITIRRAINELSLDGLIDARQGIGCFVREVSQIPSIVGLSSFTSDVASGRLRVVRTLMQDELVKAEPDIASKLNIVSGSMLRHLLRLDYESGKPFSYDEVYIIPSMATNLTPDIAGSPLFMHLWQEASGLELTHTDYEIWVEQANRLDDSLLKIDIPVLVTGELIHDSNNRPIMYIIDRYRSDRCRLSGTVILVQSETNSGIIGE